MTMTRVPTNLYCTFFATLLQMSSTFSSIYSMHNLGSQSSVQLAARRSTEWQLSQWHFVKKHFLAGDYYVWHKYTFNYNAPVEYIGPERDSKMAVGDYKAGHCTRNLFDKCQSDSPILALNNKSKKVSASIAVSMINLQNKDITWEFLLQQCSY